MFQFLTRFWKPQVQNGTNEVLILQEDVYKEVPYKTEVEFYEAVEITKFLYEKYRATLLENVRLYRNTPINVPLNIEIYLKAYRKNPKLGYVLLLSRHTQLYKEFIKLTVANHKNRRKLIMAIDYDTLNTAPKSNHSRLVAAYEDPILSADDFHLIAKSMGLTKLESLFIFRCINEAYWRGVHAAIPGQKQKAISQ